MPSLPRLLTTATAASAALLFQPWPKALDVAHSWVSTDFRAVDDRVRGGSSTSLLTVLGGNPPQLLGGDNRVQPPPSPPQPQTGEAIFSGFLDTTTLGGAGFASQLYNKPFPDPLNNQTYKGLVLVVRAPDSQDGVNNNDDADLPSTAPNATYPGGGKGPVTSYVLGLKTELPSDRPDGRRESVVNYEWRINLPSDSSSKGNAVKLEDGLLTYQAEWKDFHASYRGRPKPDAPELDVAQVKEWSIMARSDFGAQSGKFRLQMVSLGALRRKEGPIVHPGQAQSQVGEGVDSSNVAAASSSSSATTSSSSSNPPSNAGVHSKRSLPSSSTTTMSRTTLNASESYGFALYVFSSLLFLLWILWALLPDSFLKKMGIEWYPSRQWAFLIPAWSALAMLFAYVTFIALNLFNAAGREEIRGLTDSHAHLLPLDSSSILSEKAPHPLSSIRSLSETDGKSVSLPLSVSVGSEKVWPVHDEEKAHGGGCEGGYGGGGSETEREGPLSGDIYDIPPSLVSRWRGFGAL